MQEFLNVIHLQRAGHIVKVVAVVPINVDYFKEDVALMINVVVSWSVLQMPATCVELVFPPPKNAVNILVIMKTRKSLSISIVLNSQYQEVKIANTFILFSSLCCNILYSFYDYLYFSNPVLYFMALCRNLGLLDS